MAEHRLTYWVLECLSDSAAYNERFPRKKEAVAAYQKMVDEFIASGGDPHNELAVCEGISWGAPFKVEVTWEGGAFDLVLALRGEGGGEHDFTKPPTHAKWIKRWVK